MASDAGMLSGDFAETMEVIFQNVQYIVTVASTRGEALSVSVECKHDANRWRGDFSAKYIEDITSKTGNFKKFPVFVRMLLSGLRQGSDSVFVDLLTYADLEMLKARRERAGGAGPGGPGRPALPPNNKRYLILTYAAEFDRVHFPLPLLYDDAPDPADLKATIAELRGQLEEAGGGGDGGGGGSSELRRLRAENADLRDRLASSAANANSGFGPEVQRLTAVAREAERELRLMRKEKEVLLERAESAEVALEKERAAQRKESRRKASVIAELEASLADMKDAARETRAKMKLMTEELDTLRRRAKISSARAAYGAPTSRGASRASSRNPSPAPSRGDPRSRGPSPGGSRGASPRPGSRPTSAGRPGSAGRFDPTAYVRQKREAQRAKDVERSRRNFSPAGSRQSSGRSTPTREGSFDYGRARRSSGGSRGPSAERRRPSTEAPPRSTSARSRTPDAYDRPWRTNSAAREGRGSGPRGGSAAGGSRPAAPRPRNIYRDDEPEDRPLRAPSGRKPAARESPRRATSPGAALRDVKEKLSEYVSAGTNGAPAAYLEDSPTATRSYGDGAVVPTRECDSQDQEASGGRGRPGESAPFEEATEEIANIDQRLHALQSFLKSARQGGGKSFR